VARTKEMPSPPPPQPATAPRGKTPGAAAALAAVLWAALLLLVRRLPPDGREHGDLGEFIGRFHPLLVHGPVAFLVLVPLLELAGRRAGGAHLRAAAGWVLAFAAAAAFAAAFDGWLLAWSGGYRGHDVTNHLWAGVMLTAAAAAAALARCRSGPLYPCLLALTLGLMVWTAHGGGSISHGDGFLTDKMPAGLRSLLGMPAAPVPAAAAGAAAPAPAAKGGLRSVNPDNPAFYRIHVDPLLQRSCVACHRPEKHKAGLRMDTYDQLMRGGDDGPAVVPGNPAKSDMIRRLLLPPSDDDSMPSDGDKPLTPEEIQIIERWIQAGAKSG
jgi:hypothetical protein